ncbi:Uncharacterised protein [Burkholderia pseudomallei]|nr:Uncharacterised protein [Burkholderia pseudomallei]CAJ3007498.1 Uncharacterised protein [Burkholderia pseudomallei]CAJ3058727.1 Uncharacterised protein [Burkholderia pseudomallei]CAJ3068341.1 Uncharacterised protein [Burkholderia pseudomallei]CAJ3138532.1 Uncharacterised protein [Burkholderia pseudomallei]
MHARTRSPPPPSCGTGAERTRAAHQGARRMPDERAKTQRSCGANQGCTGRGVANCGAHRLPDRLDGGERTGADVLSVRRRNCSKVDYCKCPRRMPHLWRWPDSMNSASRKSMTGAKHRENNFRPAHAESFGAMQAARKLTGELARKPNRKESPYFMGFSGLIGRARSCASTQRLCHFYLPIFMRPAYNPPQFIKESHVDTSPGSSRPMPVGIGAAFAN